MWMLRWRIDLIDRAEITSLLYERNKLMLDYDHKKQFADAMMCAASLSLHYNALSIEYQRLAKTRNITADEAIALIDANK